MFFFDVQKTFDSVPLLRKLEEIGINPYILRWIRSYLTERKQYVAVEGSSSPTLQVLSGVDLSLAHLNLLSTSTTLLIASLTAAKSTSLLMISLYTESSPLLKTI